MDNRRWVYPYNSKGERCRFKDIPKSVADLKDDPAIALYTKLGRREDVLHFDIPV